MRSLSLFFRALSLVLPLSGCWQGRNIPLTVDQWLFRETGGTLFLNPEHLSLKEIHLDNGMLIGRKVIVEGVLEDVNPLGTFLVISDQSARLLVLLIDTDQNSLSVLRKRDVLQILGTVESGKKGLPVVKALALRFGEVVGELEKKSSGSRGSI